MACVEVSHRLAVAGLAAGMLEAPASAATLTVCASGCDFTGIQPAINEASPGDTVFVEAGTYTENGLTIDKAITLTGVDPGTVDPKGLLTPGTLTTAVQTSGPGNGPTLTITGPASGFASTIIVRDLHLVGNDDFDTVRVSALTATAIGDLVFDEVAITGSRAGLNATGVNAVRGLSFTHGAVSCTGASNPTIGLSARQN